MIKKRSNKISGGPRRKPGADFLVQMFQELHDAEVRSTPDLSICYEIQAVEPDPVTGAAQPEKSRQLLRSRLVKTNRFPAGVEGELGEER